MAVVMRKGHSPFLRSVEGGEEEVDLGCVTKWPIAETMGPIMIGSSIGSYKY